MVTQEQNQRFRQAMHKAFQANRTVHEGLADLNDAITALGVLCVELMQDNACHCPPDRLNGESPLDG